MVSAFDHSQVVPGVDSRSTLSPGQKSVGPEAVIVGADGGVLRVTTVMSEVSDLQLAADSVCT